MAEEEKNIIPVLFGPRDGKTLRKLYPEIDANPVFKGMPNDDVLFSWYMGIPGSPVDKNWPKITRQKSAATKCFPSNEEKRLKYSNFDVSEQVKLAIEEFKKFSPEARAVALKATENNFQNILKNSNVDIEKDFFYWDKEGNKLIDWTARKQYMDTVKVTAEILPELLKQLEQGFGLAEAKKNEEMKGNKSIDKFIQNQQVERID